jgi:hypothetical protein
VGITDAYLIEIGMIVEIDCWDPVTLKIEKKQILDEKKVHTNSDIQ